MRILEWHESFASGDVLLACLAALAALLLVWPGLTLAFSALVAAPLRAQIPRRSLQCLAVVSILWGAVAYSLAFAPSWGTVPHLDPAQAAPVLSDFQTMMRIEDAKPDETGRQGRGGVIGGLDYANFAQLAPFRGSHRPVFTSRRPYYDIPHIAFMFVQLAVLAALAGPLWLVLFDRWRPTGMLLAAALWCVLVYAPVVHWIWGDGWLEGWGAVDVAGGLPHVAVGSSALACAIGRRRLRSGDAAGTADSSPDSALTAIGTGLTWAGLLILHGALTWRADGRLALAVVNTHWAACSGLLGWLATARWVLSRSEPQHSYLGALAGLIAIAPGCALVIPQSAAIIGALAGIVVSLCWSVATRCGPVGATGAAGILQAGSGGLGLVLAGIFATSATAGSHWDGRDIQGLVDGAPAQVGVQALAVAAAVGWSFVATLLIGGIVDRLAPRADADAAG